ncbi:MAG TPA: hypothetical protein VNZ52_07665 [Candidatus Thermoplasmatota archaeon]|nr:hypothetical protein [Candidatus Thermoplasmatota archaeon]
MAFDLLSSTVVGIVAVVSLILSLLTFEAYRRVRNRKILFVAAAFLIHFVKSGFVAIAIYWRLVGHEVLELTEAGFDLVIVVLLFIPFWSRR